MISQTSRNASLNDEALKLATAANQAGPVENGADGSQTGVNRATATPAAKPAPVTPKAVPGAPVPKTPAGKTLASKTQRDSDVQKLEAHAERRQRLAERLRTENPARSDEEIEELLEQFGA
jgi:hypothetical protein